MFFGQNKLKSASRWLRLINAVIDYFGSIAFGVVILLILYLVFGEERMEVVERIPDFVVGAPLFLGYYILFEHFWGKTPGKWITGTRVVSDDGNRPSFKQIVGRSLLRLIPFEAVSFLRKSGRGLHDSLADTYVVSDRAGRFGNLGGEK